MLFFAFCGFSIPKQRPILFCPASCLRIQDHQIILQCRCSSKHNHQEGPYCLAAAFPSRQGSQALVRSPLARFLFLQISCEAGSSFKIIKNTWPLDLHLSAIRQMQAHQSPVDQF